jgi:hypothetical protein
MSVTINSGVPASASYETSLTSPPLILNQPGSGSTTGSIPISSVIGLTGILNGKLNDTAGPVGISTVFVSGTDLNLLAGMNAFGLTQADLQKLSLVNATAVELNHLVGVTGPIQAQINAAYSNTDFTAADQMIVSTGVGVGSVQLIADVLDGTIGVGYEFADLLPPTASLDFNNQRGINALDPVGLQDLATKGYVDTAVLGTGLFLPLLGGTMTGPLDMNGVSVVLDIDGDTTLSALVDDTVVLNVSGISYTWTTTGLNMGGVAITNLLDPATPQSAATRNYVDNGFVSLSGDTMTGALDMDGNTIGLDSLGSTSIVSTTPGLMEFLINGTSYVFSNTSVNFDGSDLAGLNPVPQTPLSAIHTTFANTTYIRLDGSNGPMTGTLNLGNNTLSGPLDPTVGTHVGDRDYNDARYLRISNNLSDLASLAAAQASLGLAPVAVSGDWNDLINTPVTVSLLNDLTDVITGVPGPLQDGFVLTWNNTASSYNLLPAAVRSVFGRTGIVTAASGDYSAIQITNTPVGNITATNAQAAIDELDSEKLARDGSQSMSGNLDMNNNQLLNVALPLTVTPHVWTAADYRSTLGGRAPLMRTTAVPTVATPSYSFVSNPDTGMWMDGGGLRFSIGGVAGLTIGTTAISADNRQIKDVANPVDPQDAVTRGYLEGLSVQRVLGFTTGIDLQAALVNQSFPIYTVPTGKQHIITKVILVATSYSPGVGPIDPVVSVGTQGPVFDEVVNAATASWGSAGAGDQAIYIDPKQGSETPNSASVLTLQVNSPAAGTFASLVVTAYIMGFEL